MAAATLNYRSNNPIPQKQSVAPVTTKNYYVPPVNQSIAPTKKKEPVNSSGSSQNYYIPPTNQSIAPIVESPKISLTPQVDTSRYIVNPSGGYLDTSANQSVSSSEAARRSTLFPQTTYPTSSAAASSGTLYPVDNFPGHDVLKDTNQSYQPYTQDSMFNLPQSIDKSKEEIQNDSTISTEASRSSLNYGSMDFSIFNDESSGKSKTKPVGKEIPGSIVSSSASDNELTTIANRADLIFNNILDTSQDPKVSNYAFKIAEFNNKVLANKEKSILFLNEDNKNLMNERQKLVSMVKMNYPSVDVKTLIANPLDKETVVSNDMVQISGRLIDPNSLKLQIDYTPKFFPNRDEISLAKNKLTNNYVSMIELYNKLVIKQNEKDKIIENGVNDFNKNPIDENKKIELDSRIKQSINEKASLMDLKQSIDQGKYNYEDSMQKLKNMDILSSKDESYRTQFDKTPYSFSPTNWDLEKAELGRIGLVAPIFLRDVAEFVPVNPIRQYQSGERNPIKMVSTGIYNPKTKGVNEGVLEHINYGGVNAALGIGMLGSSYVLSKIPGVNEFVGNQIAKPIATKIIVGAVGAGIVLPEVIEIASNKQTPKEGLSDAITNAAGVLIFNEVMKKVVKFPTTEQLRLTKDTSIPTSQTFVTKSKLLGKNYVETKEMPFTNMKGEKIIEKISTSYSKDYINQPNGVGIANYKVEYIDPEGKTLLLRRGKFNFDYDIAKISSPYDDLNTVHDYNIKTQIIPKNNEKINPLIERKGILETKNIKLNEGIKKDIIRNIYTTYTEGNNVPKKSLSKSIKSSKVIVEKIEVPTGERHPAFAEVIGSDLTAPKDMIIGQLSSEESGFLRTTIPKSPSKIEKIGNFLNMQGNKRAQITIGRNFENYAPIDNAYTQSNNIKPRVTDARGANFAYGGSPYLEPRIASMGNYNKFSLLTPEFDYVFNPTSMKNIFGGLSPSLNPSLESPGLAYLTKSDLSTKVISTPTTSVITGVDSNTKSLINNDVNPDAVVSKPIVIGGTEYITKYITIDNTKIIPIDIPADIPFEKSAFVLPSVGLPFIGFPGGMSGDSGGFKRGRFNKQWTVVNPLQDLPRAFFTTNVFRKEENMQMFKKLKGGYVVPMKKKSPFNIADESSARMMGRTTKLDSNRVTNFLSKKMRF